MDEQGVLARHLDLVAAALDELRVVGRDGGFLGSRPGRDGRDGLREVENVRDAVVQALAAVWTGCLLVGCGL